MPVGMLTTQTIDGATHSRPMRVQDVDDAGWLWFLADSTSRKAWELGLNPQATISFQSKHGDRYVSVQGTAIVIRDDVQAKRLWNSTMRAWFPRGRREPNLVLVAMRVTCAEYWLVPRYRIARVFDSLKAIITRRRQPAGKHGVLDLHPSFS